jgi:hypothetical protein
VQLTATADQSVDRTIGCHARLDALDARLARPFDAFSLGAMP